MKSLRIVGVSIIAILGIFLGAFFLTPLTKLREKYAVLVSKSKPVQKHSVNLEMENRILKDRLNMAAGFLEMEDRIENWVKKFDYSTVMLTAAISKEEFLSHHIEILLFSQIVYCTRLQNGNHSAAIPLLVPYQ